MATQSEFSPELTVLERAILEAALSGVDPAMADLYAQVEGAEVVLRTPSGVGFVTKLRIPDELRTTEANKVAGLPVVYGEHPDLRSGAEFVVQIKDGRINSIEAFCYEGMWPRDESLFQFGLRL